MKISIIVITTIFPLLTTSKSSTYRSITYLEDKSYTAYKDWGAVRINAIKFRFKTYLESCFLLYVENNKGPSHSSLQLKILNGKLHAEANVSEHSIKSTVEISSNLNDIQWHTVTITLLKDGVYVQVDNVKKLVTKNHLQVTSKLHIGGMKSLQTSSRFIGCIDSVTYIKDNGEEIYPDLIEKRDVIQGCINRCDVGTCKNGGKCLNLFTSASCDCMGTGFGGQQCTKAADLVFLQKDDYIRVSKVSKNVPHEKFFLTVRFRTSNSRGLLFAVDELDRGFNVAVNNGNMRIAINTLEFTLGDGMLHDAQWHRLTIKILNGIISADLDARFNARRVIPEEINVIMFPLYVGGMSKNKLNRNSLVSSDFTGCIQQLQVNDMHVIYRVLYMVRDKYVYVNNDLSSKCNINAKNEINKRKDNPTKAWTKERKNPTDGNPRQDRLHPKIIASNNKDMIAWVTSGIVSGVIVIMIITTCAIHYFKFKYDGIFLSRVRQQETGQQQQSGSVFQLNRKQQYAQAISL